MFVVTLREVSGIVGRLFSAIGRSFGLLAIAFTTSVIIFIPKYSELWYICRDALPTIVTIIIVIIIPLAVIFGILKYIFGE